MKSSYLSAWMVALTCLLMLNNSCLRPSEERAELDLLVGMVSVQGVDFEVEDGLAVVRHAEPGELELWVSSPVLFLDVRPGENEDLPLSWTLTLRNCMPGAVLTVVDEEGELLAGLTDDLVVAQAPGDVPTRRVWTLEVVPGQDVRLRVAPPDGGEAEAFRFGVLSDIQERIDDVQDIFSRMNEEPGLRFVLSTGDLTQRGEWDQLVRFQDEMEAGLKVPLYSTTGNHEMGADAEVWHQLWGRFNTHFIFKNTAFSLVDSGHATLDPLVYEWLGEWLEENLHRVHVVGTHLTPLDPAGTRNGSFRSRKEAGKFIGMIGRGGVDMTFYGHIHSYYAFSLAGIPSYISGGGGAIPERLDGIERHFLVVDVTPGERVDRVGLVRVD